MKRQYFDMLSTTAVYVKLRVQLYTMLIHHGYAHMQCRDTYWVESFNHQLLTYLSKRIHFSTPTYRMRMNLAVLDWVCFPYLLITCTFEHVYVCYIQNENVLRATTSERMYEDLRRPNRRTPKRVLVAKTFKFVKIVWSMYVQRNITDVR